MLIKVLKEFLLPFFTALGVVLGASIIGSLGTLLTFGSPLQTMGNLAKNVRIWALVVAIGGTFSTIRIIESGIFGGEIIALARQVVVILGAFLGSYLGYWIIINIVGSGSKP
ncbi:Sporulation membrane protein YtrH [Koleobacter methoxysyntrophicus]|jgi:hypothetical protein|uniref:Sporulation membrane protein YtrH n=1 Tax=Koleobacter methoxysyntrophicus TaxID=2751313 RepID=A0A8A0RPL9_9FIRM|nr:YtrH family sporulation protein [Koleobacter methoxysyntrophicus]QSQ10331.1 Sporulation membrane protein YtrH [Koleobacter methoxysyntrophicus]